MRQNLPDKVQESTLTQVKYVLTPQAITFISDFEKYQYRYLSFKKWHIGQVIF